MQGVNDPRPIWLVTRPAAQAGAWVEAFRQAGLRAEALPLIAIEAPADVAPLQQAWAALPRVRFVMFVSANAVAGFFAARPPGAGWPAGLRAGATGPGTATALLAAGVRHIVAPAAEARQFDAEALWQQLAAEDWRNAAVWVVRGEDGRDWLAQRWRDAGAAVHFAAAYRRAAPRLDAVLRERLQRALQQPRAHRWLFSSSQALAQLQALAPQATWAEATALATHPRIARALQLAGFGRVLLSRGTLPDLTVAARGLDAAEQARG